MATHTHSTPTLAASRRSLFGAVTALACIPALGVSTVPMPDAGLLRLCKAFHEAHEASHAADDDSWEAHLDRRWEISDKLEDMEPVTRAGKIAKLRVGLVLMEEQYSGDKHEDFALAAMEAIVRGDVA